MLKPHFRGHYLFASDFLVPLVNRGPVNILVRSHSQLSRIHGPRFRPDTKTSAAFHAARCSPGVSLKVPPRALIVNPGSFQKFVLRQESDRTQVKDQGQAVK